MTSIYGLITIVDRSKSGAALRIYREHAAAVSLVIRGHGTANNEIMDMLGLDEPEKDVIFSLADASTCRRVFASLDEKMHLSRPGTGIAFTCSLSGISMAAAHAVCGNTRPQDECKEEKHMEDKQRIELIVTVVDSDSTDLVVRAAKEAGAHGGTVIKAREISSDDQEKKIFGMTVQPEKEIVLMLVPEEKKAAIFKAACAAVLEHTGEHALAFTMPVSDTAGLKL